jgi:predicted transcriptional regulator
VNSFGVEWRRSKVLELSSQGHSQPEIAKILQINQPTINRDIGYLRGQARQNLQKHIQDKLPEEYQNYMTGINQVLKICWEIVNKSRNINNNNGTALTQTDNKTVLQALALINDCNKYKFIQINKEKLTMSKKDNSSKGSKEPDYNEDEDQLE